jgi:hypothetical protein
MSETPEARQFNYNPFQNTSIILGAKKEVDVCGRGTGKSSLFAWKLNMVQNTMPRSTSAISGATYQQILTRTLPPTIEALERIGIHKDIDFFIGRKPPEKYKYAQPYQPPLDYDRFLVFRNGAGFHLTSQDREGKSRGFNLSFILGDELLTQDKKKLEDEVFAGNRGGMDRFGKVHLHHGYHLASSMPIGAKSAYILDYGNYYEEDGNNFWPHWNKLCHLQLKLVQSNVPKEIEELKNECKKLRKTIRFYTSKEGVLFTVGNVFDNIANVGFEYIRSMYKQMSLTSFRIEMLNERLMLSEQAFYKINEEKHGYTNFDYGHLDGLDYNIEKLKNIDSRQDADVDKSRPLDISIDFGASINAMRVAQEHQLDFKGMPSWEYRFVKSFYVKFPQGLKDIAKAFDTYYRYHRCKEVNLPYDHTAVGRDPVRDKFINEITKYLTELGWKVNSIYLGQTSGYHNRWLLWELMLKGEDSRFPKLLFNLANDKDGILSMQLAGLKQGRHGFEKDKSTERSTTIPREQATDLSDAADTLLVWKYLAQLESNKGSFEIYM